MGATLVSSNVTIKLGTITNFAQTLAGGSASTNAYTCPANTYAEVYILEYNPGSIMDLYCASRIIHSSGGAAYKAKLVGGTTTQPAMYVLAPGQSLTGISSGGGSSGTVYGHVIEYINTP